MEQRFSPAQLAPILGVSESTLKRWVDERKLRAVKTAGGHRRIALRDLAAFLRATGREVPSFEALGLLAAEVGPRAVGGGAFTPERLATLLLEGETGTARTLLLSQFRSGRALDEILDRLVGPAMAHVGTLWERTEIDVYQEHLATQRVWRLLVELRGFLATPPSDTPLAIGGAPEDDPYLLPVLMAELALRDMGWRTLSLGPDVPLASFREALVRHRPRLVWVSVTAREIRPTFFEEYPALYETALELGAAVVIGGQGLTPGLQDRIVATAFGTRLAHLKAFARDVAAAGPRPKRV